MLQNITAIICAIYEAQNADNKKRSEYDFMTNFVKFMHQTTSSLSGGDNNIRN